MLVPSIFEKNFFEDFFNDTFTTPFKFMNNNRIMNTDVQELGDKYQLEIELPGYAKEDIKAELKDGYLTIEASHNEEKEENDKNGNYIRRERYSGTCRRSFYVGDKITEEEIKANFSNGVLKLEIPKMTNIPEIEDKKYITIE
ncbi:HSP20 family molecular chaperone IbpA [Mobilisporobacter senegalensis]|uniref:HSP20 family molecular chaperone IbpA n=1 Tax=Mobilisporobacter senegalensis TaxID=1329262 RepID=A0A3N1XWD7_9FIRM|nr:Hsp20/alpha crystallin family protein [Mobilisporobacter senegalensis]ROR29257.1 HSP20 family molecular chaperone IbpA [Mobilisporobacter senegalensis]